jgi:enterochelin esterase-like enzyme
MKFRAPGLAMLLLLLFAGSAAPAFAGTTTVVAGDIEAQTLTSSVLGRDVKLWVWLPPGYRDTANGGRPYPVLYLLDGEGMFGTGRVDEILGRLIAESRIEPVIAVAVGQNTANETGFTEGRHDEFLPYADPVFFAARPAPRGQVYPRFLVAEVLPFIAARYRVTSDFRQTAIAGNSYSGVAALYTLIQQPQKFGRAIVDSPSFQVGNGRLLSDAENLMAAGERVALGVGTLEAGPARPEINQAWVNFVQILAKKLESALIPPQIRLTVEEGAFHGTEAFLRRLPAQLIFLFGEPAKETAPPSP